MFLSKYKNQKASLDGYSFASKLEAALYERLKLEVLAGELRDIKCQPHVFLTLARIEMIPDFSAFDVKSGGLMFFEAKGFETDVWRIKRKLWTCYGPAPLKVFRGTYRRLQMTEEIIPKLQYGFELGNAYTK